jgi:hypothetical protein
MQIHVEGRARAPFVHYSLRHAFFLTWLDQPACDAWTLAPITGHSSMAHSAKRKQFLVKPVDLPRAIHEMNLKDPMPLLPVRI